MKLLNFLLIILLWNTTYRCKKDELTIDCTDACSKMIGTWKGSQYSNCLGSGWSSPCRSIRWRPGAVFDEVRFNEETISGEWGISCWRCELVGGFTLFKE